MFKPDNALYRCEQIKFCEQQAVNRYHLNDYELMTQAGTEAFFFLRRTYPQARNLAVFCGAGNNGGDGYVLARLAHEHGFSVMVYQCKSIAELSVMAQQAALAASAVGVECQSADEPLDNETDLIVDALLGIGLHGAVHGMIATAINQVNSSGLPVLSLDIPSGLDADTGHADLFCVKATHTLSFIGLKAGFYTLDGPDYCGEIHCRNLQLEPILNQARPVARLLHESTLPKLPQRKKNSHKGHFGHVLIIGGGLAMAGAAALAAKAAMRAGAGLVSIATRPEHSLAMLSLLPEAMVYGIHKAQELAALLAKATVCVIGPGLGETEWAQALFLAAITSQLPMVIDASALRLLALHPQVDDNWVLTPHPGEAGSLLSTTTTSVQQDRYQAAAAIQQLYGGVVVLKGAGTIIQTSEHDAFVCVQGNPGMATAGMGDVLTGIIAGLCAQQLPLADAAKLGVWLHAQAGDHTAKQCGERGILASDLLDLVPKILNSIET